MSLFSMFSRSKESAAEVADPQSACSHPELAPRWDSAADMGKADRIASYACTTCQASLTLEEAAQRQS